MYAVQARYRGHEKRRGAFVTRFAQALGNIVDGTCRVDGIDELTVACEDARQAADVIMVLVASGEWVVGVGIAPAVGIADEEHAWQVARSALGRTRRAGSVHVKLARPAAGLDQHLPQDIAAAFEMLRFVASRRTAEGQEATRLVRTGMTQLKAAEELGISKQAMSQRLQAAGWQAEKVGFDLAVRLLARAHGDDTP
ncbi:MarR family transcriptional regulator [Corynebacterium sp. 13CS0277]|uniref:MarR family transcriptional regulator n=1 Tax=Corynebacterium sp. 13CS0277 TaxID=2071994 RepID=UPI0011B1D143|nr:MarR family transcriptional regulator [Corynebacterium sp. 13CS0277]